MQWGGLAMDELRRRARRGRGGGRGGSAALKAAEGRPGRDAAASNPVEAMAVALREAGDQKVKFTGLTQNSQVDPAD